MTINVIMGLNYFLQIMGWLRVGGVVTSFRNLFHQQDALFMGFLSFVVNYI